MNDGMGSYHQRPEGGFPPILEFDEFYGEFSLNLGRSGEKHFHRLSHPDFHSRRPCHDKRPGASAKLSIQDKKGDPTEMVSVQMGNQDEVNE
jgi:hypothetical protein